MILVLFDIDGTLLTSTGVGRQFIETALSTCAGRPISSRGVSFSGRTDPAIVADMLRAAGFSEQDVNGLLEECLEAYSKELVSRLLPEHVTVLSGVKNLLDALARVDDVHMGLLTGNLEQTAFAKLTAGGLRDYFSWGAFGSDHEDRNRLPDIASIRAQKTLGITFPASRTLIIGDTAHDIACSRVHGAWAVGVCTGRYDRAFLEEHTPDLLLDSLDPIEPVVRFLDTIRQNVI